MHQWTGPPLTQLMVCLLRGVKLLPVTMITIPQLDTLGETFSELWNIFRPQNIFEFADHKMIATLLRTRSAEPALFWVITQSSYDKMVDILQMAFQMHFLDQKLIYNLIQISLKFVSQGPIISNPALDQIMAWCWTGHKPFWNSNDLVYWCIYASLSLGELTVRCLID